MVCSWVNLVGQFSPSVYLGIRTPDLRQGVVVCALIPAPGSLQIQGQWGLQSKFHDTRGYTEIFYLEKNFKKKKSPTCHLLTGKCASDHLRYMENLTAAVFLILQSDKAQVNYPFPQQTSKLFGENKDLVKSTVGLLLKGKGERVLCDCGGGGKKLALTHRESVLTCWRVKVVRFLRCFLRRNPSSKSPVEWLPKGAVPTGSEWISLGRETGASDPPTSSNPFLCSSPESPSFTCISLRSLSKTPLFVIPSSVSPQNL